VIPGYPGDMYQELRNREIRVFSEKAYKDIQVMGQSLDNMQPRLTVT
jgi:hypothetical protein